MIHDVPRLKQALPLLEYQTPVSSPGTVTNGSQIQGKHLYVLGYIEFSIVFPRMQATSTIVDVLGNCTIDCAFKAA